MIQIEYDRNMLAKIERRLGRMKSEAPIARLLRSASLEFCPLMTITGVTSSHL